MAKLICLKIGGFVKLRRTRKDIYVQIPNPICYDPNTYSIQFIVNTYKKQK